MKIKDTELELKFKTTSLEINVPKGTEVVSMTEAYTCIMLLADTNIYESDVINIALPTGKWKISSVENNVVKCYRFD